MGLPGSRLNSFDFDPKLVGDTIYPSLGTFLGRTVTTEEGQEINTFDPIDADHTDLRCRIAPLLLIRTRSQEHQAGPIQMSDANYQVNFESYLDDIDIKWQLRVDGKIYQIVAWEPDGQHLTMRVGVNDIVPFSA